MPSAFENTCDHGFCLFEAPGVKREVVGDTRITHDAVSALGVSSIELAESDDRAA